MNAQELHDRKIDQMDEDWREIKASAKRYLSTIGSRGGKAGTGKAKSRTRKQAQKAAQARWKDHVKKP